MARSGWLLSLTLAWTVSTEAAPADGIRVPGTPLTKYEVKDRSGRSIRYYLARPKQLAPILLMIQGSGCGMIVRANPDGVSSYSTLYNFLPYSGEGKFAVMAVEKPFASDTANSGTAKECGTAFNADFTAETWAGALQAALADVRRRGGIDPRRTLLSGESEGAVMAAVLASRDPSITDVIGVGGPGTSQLFDFIAQAYERCFDRIACLADTERQVAAINAKPDSATEFAWGHPFKRWSSFFRVDGGEALLRSRARVYMTFGTADRSVPALSQEVTVARLLDAGRDITVERVVDADHGLMRPGDRDFSGLDKAYRAALDWFWRGHRPPP